MFLPALLERSNRAAEIWTVARCVAEYRKNDSVPHADVKLLDTVRPNLALYGTGNLNYDRAEGWIRIRKRQLNLSPSTIHHPPSGIAMAHWPAV